MSETPGDAGEPNPFEGIFAAFGGGAGAPDLSALFGQIQRMMEPYEGPVNWPLAGDAARDALAAAERPADDGGLAGQVPDVLRLADHWLDDATDFPSGVVRAEAWTGQEWLDGTADSWQHLINPIAANVVGAMDSAIPEEVRTMAGPMMAMIQQAGGSMFGQQVGQALGGMAGEVLSSTEIGLPMADAGTAAIVSANVAAFADGLDVSTEDLLLWVALREAAHLRLFAHTPWLGDHVVSLVADFAAGMEIDITGIESTLSGLDPTNPAEIQDAVNRGLFEPKRVPAQEAALRRLGTVLACIEGWVDEVVTQAAGERMPVADKMTEIFRRRRAAGGPAEQTFAALAGLELRPRRLRDAANLWASLRDRHGAEVRDGVWLHPDLLPTEADLDDPLGFRADIDAPAEISDDEFDKALADLLGQADDGEPGEGREPGSDAE